MTAEAEEQIHPYEREAVEIFTSASTQAPREDQSNLSAYAHALADKTSSAKTPEGGPGVYIWSAIQALKRCAIIHPQALDPMLQTFHEAIKLFPDTVSNEYGHGPAAGEQQLKWWIVEESAGFQGLLFPGNPGKVDPADRSNLIFNESEASEKSQSFISQIQIWKEERTSWIIAAAIQARCCALDIMCVGEGQQIEALIDAGLDYDRRNWGNADLIGACVLLRGCAQTLLKTLSAAGKVDERARWKKALEKVLAMNKQGAGREFALKYHAAVSSFGTRDK